MDWSSPFQPLALPWQALLLQACTGALCEPAAMRAWCATLDSLLCCLDADKHADYVTEQQKFYGLLGIHCSDHQLVAPGQDWVAS